jgi:hypothetical protein
MATTAAQIADINTRLDTLATFPTTVTDASGADIVTGAGDINAYFAMSSAYLVFFMHCGFAMLSIGCVRAKFAKHIAMLILIDACASGLGFYLFGYAFAFGDTVDADNVSTNNVFVGTRFFALDQFPYEQFWKFFFQWTFAATACTIVSGAIAERAKFEAYIMYSSSWPHGCTLFWCTPPGLHPLTSAHSGQMASCCSAPVPLTTPALAWCI